MSNSAEMQNLQPIVSMRTITQIMDTPASIHAVFCSATGTTPNLMIHERAYADFIAHGFTGDDLRCVLDYLRRENKRMNGAKFSMRLDRLLDFEYRHFDSILCEARARERNQKQPLTPREKVLQQLRPTVSNTETGTVAITIKDVLRKISQ